mgnify:CR=1 FL=1
MEDHAEVGKKKYSTHLECPFCEQINLHHSSVTVYELMSCDEKVHIDESNILISKGNCGSPSTHGSGICINFWCEHCENFPKLNVYQYKGTTFIDWGNEDDSHS